MTAKLRGGLTDSVGGSKHVFSVEPTVDAFHTRAPYSAKTSRKVCRCMVPELNVLLMKGSG